jgi:hypothetical protein
MEIVNFPEQQNNQVGASGECPHCATVSYLKPVSSAHMEQKNGLYRIVNVGQGQSCKQFVLVEGKRTTHQAAAQLVSVYPLGKPNDAVAPEVREIAGNVAADFSEALRCHWIKSYRASVVMCRRAVQSSAIALQAKGGRLIDQIDDLFKSGKITESLRDFAHEVRLTGNDGAHPDKDGLNEVGEQDSSDIIEFTREYLHHLYVMPAKLRSRKAKGNPPLT